MKFVLTFTQLKAFGYGALTIRRRNKEKKIKSCYYIAKRNIIHHREAIL